MEAEPAAVAAHHAEQPLAVREVPHEELAALLPDAPLFSSGLDIQAGCRGTGFSSSSGSQLTLQDFRDLAVDFYASGAPRFPQDGYLAAIMNHKHHVSKVCPHAVMQALLLRIEALLLQIYTQPAQSRDQHLASFSEAATLHSHFTALTHWLRFVLRSESSPELGWPLSRGEKRVQRYYDMLWGDVYDSADTWAMMEQPGSISDELYHAAFAEVASVLGGLGLEWWPCRGTLIALLRHGWRSGNLSRGLVDVVERDIDVMLGVDTEAAWPSLAAEIERQLRVLGWDQCWAKSSAEFESSLRDTLRRDLLYCIRTSPGYMLLDITSYIKDTPGPYVFVHRVCNDARREGGMAFNHSLIAGEGCYVPTNIGPLRGGGGLLRRDSILPPTQCCAGKLSVPCPRRPLETIEAMVHSGLEASCISLPTTRGRDPDDPWTQRLQEAGLRAEDVRVLRERSARLEARGCRSMGPYFDGCSRLAEIMAAA